MTLLQQKGNFNIDPYFLRVGDTEGWECSRELCHPPTFLRIKKKNKRNKGKKERVSKQNLLKVCQQGQNVTVLAILECLKLKNFCCQLPTCIILFRVLWTFYFEIHFAVPVSGLIFQII